MADNFGSLNEAFESHFGVEQLISQGFKELHPDQVEVLKAWWLAGATDLYNVITTRRPRLFAEMVEVMVELGDELSAMDRRGDRRDMAGRN